MHIREPLGHPLRLLTLLLAGCAAPGGSGSAAKEQVLPEKLSRQDLEVVDCLLPGQVRMLGNRTYLAPRRPTRTTAAECRIRGGEYVAFDRADYKTALKVWLETAELGDAEAQTNVGEIYEKGLGTEPNYEVAAFWYQKAADQGYSRALFNLGTLYEQGLGVPADKLKALNLYRQAWGIPEDSLIFQSAARREQQQLRDELEKQLAEKDAQLKLLERQLEGLQKELSQRPTDTSAEARAEIEALRKWIAQLEAERQAGTQRLAALPKIRSPQELEALPTIQPATDPRAFEGLEFGRYYALIIGNQDYEILDDLETPINDAERAASLLRDKYGFSVQVLEDADDVAMLKALNDLNEVLKPEDNVLIYYAGHGTRLQTGKSEAGYWLPVNAEPPPKDTFWVPNEQITAHLGRLTARRVLVVADSCYAGLLSTDPGYLFLDDKVGYSKDYIRYKLPKRSRLLLSSGGDSPVLDEGGAGHSVFARAFLDELEANQGVLASPDLFTRIRKRVEVAAARSQFVQAPEFKSIKGAGHEVGDFFFVPKSAG